MKSRKRYTNLVNFHTNPDTNTETNVYILQARAGGGGGNGIPIYPIFFAEIPVYFKNAKKVDKNT